jgi:hypothetical protein
LQLPHVFLTCLWYAIILVIFKAVGSFLNQFGKEDVGFAIYITWFVFLGGTFTVMIGAFIWISKRLAAILPQSVQTQTRFATRRVAVLSVVTCIGLVVQLPATLLTNPLYILSKFRF